MAAAARGRRVLLFSGHRIDTPGRAVPRFPAHKAQAAATRIADALAALGAGPDDASLSQAAAGGDLLFLETALARGVRCRVLLPLPEEEFVRRSVLPSADGAAWRDRWFGVRPRLAEPPRILPEVPAADAADVFERCNLWLLDAALAEAGSTAAVTLLALWNGAGGDGPGGTRHMIDLVRQRGGHVHWIDTRTL